MPRGRESIQYQVKSRMEFSQNDVTKKSQKAGLKFFIEWAKSQGVRDLTEEDPIQLIQRYSDYMQNETSYTPGTIHTRLAPVCKALDVPMGQISKPKRTQDTLIRGRTGSRRAMGEEKQEKYKKSVQLQRAVGIRRAELARLTGADLVEFDGHLCVYVKRGKGGKAQYQRILPQYQDTVKRIMGDVLPDQRVLEPSEMGEHIDYHGMRAELARNAYDYYMNEIMNGNSQKIKQDLRLYYAKMHPQPSGTSDRDCVRASFKWMNDTLGHNGGIYKLRGESKARALQIGRPTEYSRLALLAVSVFHLSHWRLDVTVTNYMLH